MIPAYFAIGIAIAVALYFGVRIMRGDRCPNCRALLGRETGEKRAMENGRGVEWEIVCGDCGHTEVQSEQGLACIHCERPTAIVESSYTGTNGFELWGIRCLTCGSEWKKQSNYTEQ